MNDASPPPSAIVLERVTRYYESGRRIMGTPRRRITALSDLNLDIERGEIFGLVGESGSGKTTVARLIARLESPDEGTVRYNGRDIARLRGRSLKQFRQKVQMIFQDPYQSLNPYQSVRSIVMEPLIIHGMGNRLERQNKVLDVLGRVGLTPPEMLLGRHPHQLSGGQRQRVAIARALVLNPDVLIADEPTSMLDVSIAVQIFRILSDIQRRLGITMVFITHHLAAAHYLCDRIAVIYHGRLVEIGPAETMIARPHHPYTRALLDALPRFEHPNADQRYNTLKSTEHPEEPPSQGCPFFLRCAPANDQCRRQSPPMREVGYRHRVACFVAPEEQ